MLPVVASLVLLLPLAGCLKQPSTEPEIEATEASVFTQNKVKVLTKKEKQKIARQFFQEMYLQIFLRPPATKKEYIGWVNVLYQGGSIEGVYRGLTLSSEYRELEQGKAKLSAVRFFAREVARLRLSDDATDEQVNALAGKLFQKISSLSIFTLKRELGDRMLSHYDGLKTRQEKSQWYGAISKRWAELGVDFGLEQRNKADEKYHANWASNANEGYVQWEILNKVNRLMNHYGGLKVDAGKSK